MRKRRHSATENEDIKESSSSTTYQEPQSTQHEQGPDIIEENTNTLPTESLNLGQSLTPLIVGNDGYAEGSIVSITLQNFMSYDYCEIYPGPLLNLLIGPNGTGKSSIVCALALGLGNSPSLLGRARNISEFVKSGEARGSIKIELKKVDGPNIVIKRYINKDNNSSTWKLNGRSTPLQMIKIIVRGLYIQEDNLCQFLPQDRVVEFAQLSPPLLLRKTLETLGNDDLKNQLDELVEKQPNQQRLDKSIISNTNFLDSLQQKTRIAAKDVDKYNEWQQLTKKITLLEATRPLCKFFDAENLLAAATESENQALAEKSRLECEVAHLNLVLQKCKETNESDMLQRSALTEQVTETQSKLRARSLFIAKQVLETKQRANAVKGIQNRIKTRQEDAQNMKTKINKLEATVRVEPPMEDLELEETIKMTITEISQISLQINEAIDTAKEQAQRKQVNGKRIDNLKTELGQLRDISRMRLSILQQGYNDSFKAYMWYCENRTLFRGRIFGPIQLTLNLKDKTYMDYVEVALGGKNSSHLQTFVCEYADDYQKFTAELVDKQQLRLTAGWPGDIDTAATIKTPCTEKMLKENFGLDHFVINLLDGPPLVLAYLCQQIHINCIPVGRQYVSIEKIVDQSYFQQFIVAGSLYHVKKYRYGLGGAQTTVRPIPRATLLTDEVKRESYERKQEELKQLEVEAEAIDSEMKAQTIKKQEHVQKLNELKHRLENHKALKRDILDKHAQWEGQKKRLARHRQDLEVILKRPAELEQEIENLKIQIVDKTKNRGELVVGYLQDLVQLVKKVAQRNKTSLKGLSSHTIYQQMKAFAKSKQVQVNEAVKKHEQAQQETKLRKAAIKSCHQEAEEAGKDLPRELKTEFRKACALSTTSGWNKSEEEIEDDINGLQARKNAITLTNPAALNTHEKLLAEVKDLEQKIRRDKHEVEILSKEIAQVTEQWETRLEQLVSQIDKKFSIGLNRIGCAGQVAIGRDESFKNWGIEIRVKFRDDEKLQRLTEHRQSGGERAVTTILYLMALQSLARTPFRVVDEINQGMDPRNERMIHEQIIKSASLSGTSQYFIITPKLLTDLYYDEHMRVLCVYNGEWQPKNLKSVAHYLRKKKADENFS